MARPALPHREPCRTHTGFHRDDGRHDLRDHAVIDWKFPGTTKMSTVRRDQHPGILYEVQAHLYGLGALRAGLTPHRADRVHPTRRILHQHLRVEVPWNPEIAMAAINRMTSTIAMAADLQVDRHPDRYAVFPATPFQCDYCPGTTSNPPDRTSAPAATKVCGGVH